MDRVFLIVGVLSRLMVCMAVAVVVCGCGDGESASGPSEVPGAPAAAISAKPAITETKSQSANRYAPAPASSRPVVRINTSLGPIEVRLDAQAAPVTVQNFLNYAQSGHYDETVFHYIEEGRLILGGGLKADGTSKPVGMAIRNEAHNGRKNKKGTIAMARDAAVIDSAASQFFINLEDAPHLDHTGDTADEYGYCVFGDIVSGLDVAEQISAIPTETQRVEGADVAVPTKTVRIESVQIVR